MAQAWQTLEEAALTLGVSLRTLHRRLARNELVTRMESGRREVLVVLPDPEPSPEILAAAEHAEAEAADALADTSDTAGDDDPVYDGSAEVVSEEIQQTMLALHEDRLRRTDLAIMAYQQSVTVAAADARRAVVRSRVAWSAAAVMTVSLFLATTWATHAVTKIRGDVSHLSDSVRHLTSDVEVKSREIKELRQESQQSKVAAARAEGELAAAKTEIGRLVEAQQQAAAAAAQVRVASAAVAPEASPAAATQPAMTVTAATQPSATTQPVAAPVAQVP